MQESTTYHPQTPYQMNDYTLLKPMPAHTLHPIRDMELPSVFRGNGDQNKYLSPELSSSE